MIVGDNDQDSEGDHSPGKEGAKDLARAIVSCCPSVKFIFPPDGVKDLRQWRCSGLTRAELANVIDATQPIRLTVKFDTINS